MGYKNVAESAALYDTVVICKNMYGKETSIGGWFNTFAGFAANEKHTYFKSRTEGSSHLAYCNMQSADNVDFVFKVFSFGVRFFAPVNPDCLNYTIQSPSQYAENMPVWWMFDLPKFCGIDFRVQQDVIIENSCLATPSGYGPRGGGGAQPAIDTRVGNANQIPWKTIVGTIGEPSIDNRFPLPNPIEIPRNTPIEANVYVSEYGRYVLRQLAGPEMSVMLTENQVATPGGGDYLSMPNRYGIQVSLYGYREVQQRGQYFAAGAIQSAGEG
jgi:hypothetical protein